VNSAKVSSEKNEGSRVSGKLGTGSAWVRKKKKGN